MPSLTDVCAEAKALGLLPGAANLTAAYDEIPLIGALGSHAGYSHMLRKVCANTQGWYTDSEQIQQKSEADKVDLVIFCHEVLHALHARLDAEGYIARGGGGAAATYDSSSDWPLGVKNEEEQLTIIGALHKMGAEDGHLQELINAGCNPATYNENSMCGILNLTPRVRYNTRPT